MDKIKKYIRCGFKCGFKIVTSWKFIVFFLGITFICYYILLNRFEITALTETTIIVRDKIVGDGCVMVRKYGTNYYTGLQGECSWRFFKNINEY